jgi:Tfp pilus assembly PilM family ATPase
MATVSIQFEENQILVAAARASAKRLQVSHLFSIALTGDDSLVAEALKAKLAQNGLARSDAVIVISRADAEMRELVIPPAPDHEVPDMVRFIARNEFASLNENWALDYLPIAGDATQSRQVLAVGISPELQEQVKNIATSAGLKIKHIVLRPFSSIDLIRSKLDDDKCRLLVDPNGDQTDMTIIDGDSLIATRTVRIPESYDANQRADSMLSEIRRTLASSRKMLGDRKISKVLLFGDAERNKTLEGNLRGQLDLAIEFIQPLSLAPLSPGCKKPDHAERYAAVLGSLVRHTSARPHMIDFVNPRRPVASKRDLSKWYLYGGLALAASLLAVVFGWWTLHSRSTINDQYAKELLRLKTLNNGNETSPSADRIMAEIAKIDEWKSADVNWLEELAAYSQRSLTPDDSIVDSLDAVAPLRADSDPRIVVNMRVTEVSKESELINQLGTRPYRVKPRRGAEDSNDKSYPLATSLTITFPRDQDELTKQYDDRAKDFLEGLVKQNRNAVEESGNDETKPEAKPD